LKMGIVPFEIKYTQIRLFIELNHYLGLKQIDPEDLLFHELNLPFKLLSHEDRKIRKLATMLISLIIYYSERPLSFFCTRYRTKFTSLNYERLVISQVDRLEDLDNELKYRIKIPIKEAVMIVIYEDNSLFRLKLPHMKQILDTKKLKMIPDPKSEMIVIVRRDEDLQEGADYMRRRYGKFSFADQATKKKLKAGQRLGFNNLVISRCQSLEKYFRKTVRQTWKDNTVAVREGYMPKLVVDQDFESRASAGFTKHVWQEGSDGMHSKEYDAFFAVKVKIEALVRADGSAEEAVGTLNGRPVGDASRLASWKDLQMMEAIELSQNPSLAQLGHFFEGSLARELGGGVLECLESLRHKHMISEMMQEMKPRSTGFRGGEFKVSKVSVENERVNISQSIRVVKRRGEEDKKTQVEIKLAIQTPKAVDSNFLRKQFFSRTKNRESDTKLGSSEITSKDPTPNQKMMTSKKNETPKHGNATPTAGYKASKFSRMIKKLNPRESLSRSSVNRSGSGDTERETSRINVPQFKITSRNSINESSRSCRSDKSMEFNTIRKEDTPRKNSILRHSKKTSVILDSNLQSRGSISESHLRWKRRSIEDIVEELKGREGEEERNILALSLRVYYLMVTIKRRTLRKAKAIIMGADKMYTNKIDRRTEQKLRALRIFRQMQEGKPMVGVSRGSLSAKSVCSSPMLKQSTRGKHGINNASIVNPSISAKKEAHKITFSITNQLKAHRLNKQRARNFDD
jgi:CRISPR/Cas system-associated exonuclease Cas4 (RecB family)